MKIINARIIFFIELKVKKIEINLAGPEEAMDSKLGWAILLHFGESKVIIEGIIFRKICC
jgi:hypothetical protein